MALRRFMLFTAVAGIFGSAASAGLRTPGKYCGVVVFDRWDGCKLYSGIYVMDIAERVKAQLRDHAGECVQINAKQVRQYRNPGDGVISEFDNVRSAPSPKDLAAVDLRVVAAFADGEHPSFRIFVRNTGDTDFRIDASEFAPTLLMKRANATGGQIPSFSLVTRQGFWSLDGPRSAGHGVENGQKYAWKVDAAPPRSLVLKPKEEHVVTIRFDLPTGEYDFLAGYGGGTHAERCVASNLAAFNIDGDGNATAVKVERK